MTRSLYEIGMQASSGASNGTVNCPICNELVSGKRFAPHLEKCMNGGKRGSKRHYDYLHEETGSKTQLKPKSTEIVEQLDPYPRSLVVRLKLRNGGDLIRMPIKSLYKYLLIFWYETSMYTFTFRTVVPRANQKRMGATMDEFLSGKVGETPIIIVHDLSSG